MKNLIYIQWIILFCSCQSKTNTEPVAVKGSEVYNKYCTACHGESGNAMISGAKDLTKSNLSKQDIIAMIKKGKGAMAGYESILSEEEVLEVTEYVYAFRKP